MINVDGNWQTSDDFADNLNRYYLDAQKDVTLDFPEIPSHHTTIAQIDELQVFRLLESINTKKATNSMDFPSWVSKNNAAMICEPMHDIINTILATGKYPSLWKKAEISPIDKVKNPTTYKDRRPILLLFHLGKIAEKAINTLLQNEVEGFTNQFAYTQTIGTNNALVKFTNDIVMSLEDESTLAAKAVLIDFSKAFDCMRPDLPIRKMLQLNVNPLLIQVVKCFLSDRQQCIKYQNIITEYLPVKIGVPQGTLTGPILWNMFVDDLQPDVTNIKYADDTTLYGAIHKSQVEISESSTSHAVLLLCDNPLQHATSCVKSWSDQNGMILNASKTTAITFSLRKTIQSDSIMLNETPIQELSTAKLFVVVYDQHLTFSHQINNVLGKAAPSFHALVQLKRAGVNSAGLLAFYKSRIVSVLSYGAPAWFPHITKHAKERLSRYEKLCLKIIYPSSDSYDDRLAASGLTDIISNLDMMCLKYVTKVKQNPNHPLNTTKYFPVSPVKARTTRYRPSSRKYRTALFKSSLFFRHA